MNTLLYEFEDLNHKPKRKSQVSTDYLCTPTTSILPTFLRTSAFDTTLLNYCTNLSISPEILRITVLLIKWLQRFCYSYQFVDVDRSESLLEAAVMLTQEHWGDY